jgi:microcin C transport system substrate-binding protein
MHKEFCMRLTAILILMLAMAARGDESFPKIGWKDGPDPIAAPEAIAGGSLTLAGIQTKSLNGYLDSYKTTQDLFGLMYETLLGLDPLTSEFVPGLARRWTLGEDKRTFTFDLDPAARWSDGQPVVAADVRWTFDAIMNPTNETGPNKMALEVFAPPEIIDAHTVRFVAREAHWRNLLAVGGFAILPRHVFANQDFNKINFAFPVVSGPYRLDGFKENVEIRLERRTDWWARSRPSTTGTYNFQTLVTRFFSEQENAFEAMRKGDIDIHAVYTARIWANETRGDRFDRRWIVKQRVRNHNPVGFQGFAMNLRRPPFDDLRVRQALAYLLDRETMNRTLMYNAYFLHTSYFESLYDSAHPCTNRTYAFNPEEAGRLLQAAGWIANPKSGLRERNGRTLGFTFLTRDGSSDKFLALYAADLRKAGIELKIERKDPATWMRDMDAFNFDMTWAAYSAGRFPDPEYQWHSREADRPAGNNVTGFKDARVDALIERQRTEFDPGRRAALCREIDALLTASVPYVLLWNIDNTRLLYWDKFGVPPTVLSKFGDESAVVAYWWNDPDATAELKAAMAAGSNLPARPESVDFDKVFKGGVANK